MTGFSRVYIDHVLNPGYCNWKRLSYALEHVLSDTGRLAADMFHKAAPEVGLLVFPDELVQTSSIMPQKRNPRDPRAHPHPGRASHANLTKCTIR